MISLSGIRTLAVAADREGRFTIGPVPPGDYTITASAADHVFFPPAHKISITTQPIPAVRFVALKRPQPAKNR